MTHNEPVVYFTALDIENVRCFGERQRLDLTRESGRPARWTLILGDNGAGKTTLLQCLEAALLRKDRSSRDRSSSKKDRSSRELTLGAKLLSFGSDHPVVVAAYGANRGTELYEKILSNLDYASRAKGPTSREHTQLDRLREVLARILPGEFKPTDIEILPPDVLDSGEPSGVRLKSFSGLVPMSALGLGYQTTLAWTADVAWRLLKRFPESPNPLAEPAVVLIDEIDLHLHPLWQLRIIDDLSAIFPGTQFVATSHSPLVVQVADANFVLLRKRETGVEIVNDPEVVRTWRVDQILASELFDVARLSLN